MMEPPKPLCLSPLASALAVIAGYVLVPSSLHALEWRFVPQVSTAITLTDNASQTANGDGAAILSVTPGFTLTSEGSRRIQTSVSYALTATSRFGENNSNDVYHNLSAISKAELIDDFLYLDGTATLSQGLISLFGSNADATTNDANRTAVGVYSLSPYIRKRFGTFANAEARYTLGGAIFGDNTAADAVTNSFSASLDSGTRFNDLSWSVDYSLYHSDNNGGTGNSTFERGYVTLGYALTRKFRVFGTYGDERNEYQGVNSVGGAFYSVGAGWSPSRRTSIEGTIGERYFGRTYSFSARHQTRASNWHINYSEDISDVSQQFLRDSGRSFWLCSSSPNRVVEARDFNPPSSDCVGPFSSSQLTQAAARRGIPLSSIIAAGFVDVAVTNGVYINRSLTGGVSWTKGRLGLGLSVLDNKRIYQNLTDVADRTRGITSTVSYRLNPRTSTNTSLSITENSLTVPGVPKREDRIYGLTFGVDHTFGKDLSGSLYFRHQQRESSVANGDYSENSLTASANLRF